VASGANAQVLTFASAKAMALRISFMSGTTMKMLAAGIQFGRITVLTPLKL
jgi:hypothetical protein